MRRRCHGTPEQFNDESNAVAGLINFRRRWDRTESKEYPVLMAKMGARRAR